MKKLVLILLAFSSTHSLAYQNMTENERALELIANFADRICDKVPIQGQAESLELTGTAKAELDGLLRKAVELGLSGAAKYQQSAYQGVLQKDLIDAMKSSRTCKLDVWNDLKEKLISPMSGGIDGATESATITIGGMGSVVNIMRGDKPYQGGYILENGATTTIYIANDQVLYVNVTGMGVKVNVESYIAGNVQVNSNAMGTMVTKF